MGTGIQAHVHINILQVSLSEEQQVHDLIAYLKRGTNKTYRGFLYALSETGQRQVVTEILEETVTDLTPTSLLQQVRSHLN